MLIAALYVSDTSSHSCALSSPRSVNYMVTNTVNSSMTPFGVHLFAPEQQLTLEKSYGRCGVYFGGLCVVLSSFSELQYLLYLLSEFLNCTETWFSKLSSISTGLRITRLRQVHFLFQFTRVSAV